MKFLANQNQEKRAKVAADFKKEVEKELKKGKKYNDEIRNKCLLIALEKNGLDG
jgi:hypothetical protein